jgi:hypothetical protein
LFRKLRASSEKMKALYFQEVGKNFRAEYVNRIGQGAKSSATGVCGSGKGKFLLPAFGGIRTWGDFFDRPRGVF